MIELIEVLFQPVSICLLFFCRAGTELSKCSDLYGISLSEWVSDGVSESEWSLRLPRLL